MAGKFGCPPLQVFSVKKTHPPTLRAVFRGFLSGIAGKKQESNHDNQTLSHDVPSQRVLVSKLQAETTAAHLPEKKIFGE
jgi:hypothetical protein